MTETNESRFRHRVHCERKDAPNTLGNCLIDGTPHPPCAAFRAGLKEAGLTLDECREVQVAFARDWTGGDVCSGVALPNAGGQVKPRKAAAQAPVADTPQGDLQGPQGALDDLGGVTPAATGHEARDGDPRAAGGEAASESEPTEAVDDAHAFDANGRRHVGIQTVRLADIRVDEKLYPREAVDDAHVQALRDNLSAVAARIVVSEALVLVDGRHRLGAMQAEEREEAEVEVYAYRTDADLYCHAIELNATHGRQLTPTEKRNLAVELCEAGVGVERIARTLGTSSRTVRRWTADERTDQQGHRDGRIHELREQGLSERGIAAELGVPQPTVHRVIQSGQMADSNQPGAAEDLSPEPDPVAAHNRLLKGLDRVVKTLDDLVADAEVCREAGMVEGVEERLDSVYDAVRALREAVRQTAKEAA